MKLKKFNEFLNEDYQAYHKGEPIKNSWDRLQKTKWRPADGFTKLDMLGRLFPEQDSLAQAVHGIGPDNDALKMDAAVQSASKRLKGTELGWEIDKLQRAIFGLGETDVLSVARASASKLSREKVEEMMRLFSIIETEPSTIDQIVKAKPAPKPAPSPAEIIAAIGTKLRPDAVLGFAIMRAHVLGIKHSVVRNDLAEFLP